MDRLILGILFLILSSCGNDSDELLRDEITTEGGITDGFYSSKQFGWSMKVPQSWEVVTSDSEIDSMWQEGRAMLDNIDADLPQSNEPIQLLFTRKNNSSFIAVAEKLKNKKPFDLKQLAYEQKKLVTEMYEGNGLQVMESKVDEGSISGVKCGIVRLMIGDRENQFGQVYYVFERRGYALSFIITFVNEDERDQIYESLDSCIFD